MMHTSRCPHCKVILKYGHGDPFKHIASPFCCCGSCGKPYIDSTNIEWSIAPLRSKLSLCCANNRWILLCFPPMLLCIETSPAIKVLIILLLYVVLIALFYLYIITSKQIEIKASRNRTVNTNYIKLLISSGYPVCHKIKEQLQCVF